MRVVRSVGFLLVAALTLSGCGSGNKAKAEKNIADSAAEMSKLITAFESGDKAAVRNGVDRVVALAREAKTIKVTNAENDAMKKKAQDSMAGMQDRLANAMKKAIANGTFTTAELQEIATKMQEATIR